MKRILSFLALLCLVGAASSQDKPAAHGRGYKPLPPAEAKALHDAAFKRHGYLMRILAKNVTPPAKFDCNDLGIVGPVVDQGSCGDCYGVSSSDAMTGAFIKGGWGKNDGSFKISDQYGLDCGAYEGGCNGGDEAQVIGLMKSKGFPAEKYTDLLTGNKLSDYGGYTASPGKCQLKPGAKLWQLKDWGYVAGDQGSGPATLDEYKAALLTYGQLSIALDASSFNSYTSGVIKNLGNSIDHAITVTGWDDAKNAIHIRNNWGTSWGEQGYAWVDYAAVKQIVEPIWLLAPSVAPPPPPPPPPAGNAPVITSAATATAQVNAAFSFQVAATNSPSVFLATGLPAGLTISTVGLISGTPTATGVSAVTVVAANGSGAGTQVLTITVGTTPPPPPTPPGGPVTVLLTADQVASVVAQSGVVVITADMTLKELSEAIAKAAQQKPAAGASDRKIERELQEQRRALEAIMKALLQRQEEMPKR